MEALYITVSLFVIGLAFYIDVQGNKRGAIARASQWAFENGFKQVDKHSYKVNQWVGCMKITFMAIDAQEEKFLIVLEVGGILRGTFRNTPKLISLEKV